MFQWLFEKIAQLIPDWLYAITITRLYRYESGECVFKAGKYLSRLITGKGELERLCSLEPQLLSMFEEPSDDDQYSETMGLLETSAPEVPSTTIMLIDRSITHSTKLLMERRLLDTGVATLPDLTDSILKKKVFANFQNPKTPQAYVLKASLDKIMASRLIEHEINHAARTKYDSENKRHEAMLLELWDHLMPNEPLKARKSTQWQTIGFQGRDPATDFRGMGILGLEDLLYLAKSYPDIAHSILDRAGDPTSWYSFAVVGIHITAYTVELLCTRLLQLQLFHHGVSRRTCHEIYCYLFIQFDQFWFSQSVAPTVMDFERLFAQFRGQIRARLFQLKPLALPRSMCQKDQ